MMLTGFWSSLGCLAPWTKLAISSQIRQRRRWQKVVIAETQGRRLTRQELYDLVWSGPFSGLPPLVGVSTVTIAKTCREMHVPTPLQSYWLRQKTGKNGSRIPLPKRPPGLADDIMFAGDPCWLVERQSLFDDELWGAVPPEPIVQGILGRRDGAISSVRGSRFRILVALSGKVLTSLISWRSRHSQLEDFPSTLGR